MALTQEDFTAIDEQVPPQDILSLDIPEVIQGVAQEIVVGRDFESELSSFNEKYLHYSQQKKDMGFTYPNPYINDLIQLEKEVFEAIPLFNETPRHISPHNYGEYIKTFSKNSATIIDTWKNLAMLKQDPSFLTPQNCVSLLASAWNSIDKIDQNDVYPSDYPSESTVYECIFKEIFQQTVDTISN